MCQTDGSNCCSPDCTFKLELNQSPQTEFMIAIHQVIWYFYSGCSDQCKCFWFTYSIFVRYHHFTISPTSVYDEGVIMHQSSSIWNSTIVLFFTPGNGVGILWGCWQWFPIGNPPDTVARKTMRLVKIWQLCLTEAHLEIRQRQGRLHMFHTTCLYN